MNRLLPAALALVLASPLSAETLVYRETSQGKTTQETATLTRTLADGLSWESVTLKDTTSRVGRTADGTLVAADSSGPDGKWSLRAKDDALTASGAYQGKPLSGSLALKGRLWSLGFEQPLRWAVTHKLTTPLTFLMANPDLAKSQEMILTPDGQDTVAGRPALRYKLALPGAMAMFWSAVIWANPATGEQVQYKGNKGPGTPDVVLVIDRQG
jgi:hypothetical protein